jgi:hypothetical protein
MMRARQASSPRCHLLGQEVREVFGGPESTVIIREDRAAPLGRSIAVERGLTHPYMASNSRRRPTVSIACPSSSLLNFELEFPVVHAAFADGLGVCSLYP